MAELDTDDREKLDKRKFAYVDKEGEGHLPINDDEHVRNAMARFNQTDFESGTKKETARKKIVGAAKRRGIKVNKADNVAKGRKRTARKAATRKASARKASARKTTSSRKKAKR
jgi:hypothetical protein